MVDGAGTHSPVSMSMLEHEHEHEHEHELVPAQVGALAQVSVGKYVTINYTLRTNGAIRHIRSAVWGDEPLEYQHGSGRLLPGLERALEGRVEGERFVVTLPPEDAYGERDKALQQRVPAETFGGVDQIEAGMCFLAHSEDGRRVENVMVTEVDEDNGFVVVDTNHPLAGMALEFEVCVVSVRDAPATSGCGKAHEPGHRQEGKGDGLAQEAARATLASRARPRKPGSGEAAEPAAHSVVRTTDGTGKA
jgi:FKBP-type peptidyl-prolyl cis-trans isomerase SlyD